MQQSEHIAAAQRNWRSVQAGHLDDLLFLLTRLYRYGVALERVPMTEADLMAALLDYGRQARGEVSRGNLTGALKQISFLAGNYGPVTWESFGFSHAQVLEWIREFAVPVYRSMRAEHLPDNAMTLVDLPYVGSWDDLLEPGADGHIAELVVEWANARYATLLDEQADPAEALAAAVDLADQVSIWQALADSVHRGGDSARPSTLIYDELNFTFEDCQARIDYWAPLAPD